MNKKARNKIKKGGLWVKKDTGVVIEIVAKRGKGKWTTRRINRNLGIKASHQIAEYEILKFYEKL